MDWILLLNIIIIYLTVLVIMKFMGKREIGQLSLFDFVVILVIADVAVTGIDNTEVPFYHFITGIVLIALIQKLLAFILLKFPKLRNFIDGNESIIVYEGKLNIKEMKKQSYNIDDLIIQMRIKNVRSLSEIRFAILEANGELSVFRYQDFQQQSPSGTGNSTSTMPQTLSPINNQINSQGEQRPSGSQIGKKPEDDILPFPVIVSGVINRLNLKIIQKTEQWLLKEVQKKGYRDIKDVYYANYENGDLFIAETCDLQNF